MTTLEQNSPPEGRQSPQDAPEASDAWCSDPRAVSEALRAAAAGRDEALAEVEALRRDRAWEADRANEAARLSADARDRAEALNGVIAELREQLEIVEGDRLEQDNRALNILAEHGIEYDIADLMTPLGDALREARGRPATELAAAVARLNREAVDARLKQGRARKAGDDFTAARHGVRAETLEEASRLVAGSPEPGQPVRPIEDADTGGLL